MERSRSFGGISPLPYPPPLLWQVRDPGQMYRSLVSLDHSAQAQLSTSSFSFSKSHKGLLFNNIISPLTPPHQQPLCLEICILSTSREVKHDYYKYDKVMGPQSNRKEHISHA